jgi:hypothetical protein
MTVTWSLGQIKETIQYWSLIAIRKTLLAMDSSFFIGGQ